MRYFSQPVCSPEPRTLLPFSSPVSAAWYYLLYKSVSCIDWTTIFFMLVLRRNCWKVLRNFFFVSICTISHYIHSNQSYSRSLLDGVEALYLNISFVLILRDFLDIRKCKGQSRSHSCKKFVCVMDCPYTRTPDCSFIIPPPQDFLDIIYRHVRKRTKDSISHFPVVNTGCFQREKRLSELVQRL